MALVGWALLIVVALAWGAQVGGPDVKLRAAPVMGRWAWRFGPGLLPAAAVGAAVAAWGPSLAARLRWRRMLILGWATSVAWTLALAASDGWHRVTEPLTTRHEYEPLAATIDDLGGFVAGYVHDLPGRPIHVQGHPPGPVVVAWLADAAGLGGAGWLAALALAAWGGAAVAALVALRTVAGEAAARRAAPALVVLPAAVWAGTSLDALFAGLVALSIAVAALAAARASAGLAVAAGVAFGGALLSSYGAAPSVLVVAAAVAAGAAATTGAGRLDGPAVRRALTTGATVAAAGLAVLAAVAAAGFWWFDGLDATRAAYWAGVASDRPALYLTLAGNPAALALAVGPAVVAGLTLVWTGRGERSGPLPAAPARASAGAWGARACVLPAAALVAVVAADLSQHSRGEVERIWLPFVPWLALAAPGDRRGWLAAQVAVAVTLQAALRSPW